MATQQPPPTCTKPVCPPIACAPSCDPGYNCRLSVIGSTCQCPVASCVKIDFDIGAGNGDNEPDSKPSIIGPIIGAVAGLATIALIAFVVIRRRRRQQQKKRSSVLMLGQDESSDSFSKRYHHSSGSEFAGHKDVIRIAYIPSMIGDSPVGQPEPSALTAPQRHYSSLRNDDRNKHDSVGSMGSHLSAVLDEAVVMAVTAKATPQVLNFNAIKATQSDLIQRSNTLHSSNSIKRSTSQRRVADAKKNTTGQRNPSPLAGGTQANSDSDHESDPESSSSAMQSVQMKRRSSGKQYNLDSANPFMTASELATGSALPSPASARHNNNEDTLVSISKGPHRNSNPFMTQSESATLTPDNNINYINRFSTASSSAAPSPALSSSSTFASIPIRFGGDNNNPSSPFADLPGSGNLRPWMSSGSGSGGSTAMRDSTFSTMSDARSSTQGNSEEIMIFWGGQHNRDSKASNV
ncbi:hypothetical protein BGX29_005796 [Mortierella sp. GBA35]|nr:hypothetical protein BGX29_005796 [Mortierella sp. GBA35]